MNISRDLSIATVSVLVLLIVHPFIYAQKSWKAPPIVTRNCSGCHGVDGNAELPYIPRLAGLDPGYAGKKMAEYKETPLPSVDEVFKLTRTAVDGKKVTVHPTRNERINMVGLAHGTNAESVTQAIAWYAKQCPAPGHRGDKALIEQGSHIFANGVPELKILPCVSCHGQDAEGRGSTPRLAGQNAEYIQAQIDKFRTGDRQHAPEMTMVVREIDLQQALAIATYLQSK